MNIEKEEGRLRDKISESKINWWNGSLIFSGLALTFLSYQDKNLYSSILISLYFIIAGISFYLIFKIKKFYDFLSENCNRWISKDILEEEKEKNISWASKEHRIIIKCEKILEWMIFPTIILTFVYIFINSPIPEAILRVCGRIFK